jgi:hypothetical protein
MTHFLKLCYNVFILENKIDALMFIKICVKMCYITLEIAKVCANMRGFPSSGPFQLWRQLIERHEKYAHRASIDAGLKVKFHFLSLKLE